MNKRRAQAGETLPETLAALLIVVLTFLFLTGAVVSAGRINRSVQNDAVVFRADPNAGDSLTVNIGVGGPTPATVTATLYRSENGYVYYE